MLMGFIGYMIKLVEDVMVFVLLFIFGLSCVGLLL